MGLISILIYFEKDVGIDNETPKKNLISFDLGMLQYTSHYLNFYNRHRNWNWKKIEQSFYIDYEAILSQEELFKLIGKTKEECIEKSFRIKSIKELETTKNGYIYRVNSLYEEIKINNIEKIIVKIWGD
jgi:hypothetical protein